MSLVDQPTVPTRPPDPARSTPPGVWVAPSVEELQVKLPQYEVLEILGRGGMGAVYKARQKSLKRLVAIKILPLGMADDEFKFVERFQNEAQTMAQMNHPAIVSVYDFGETSDGLLYFVMEFVDGTDVHKMIQSSGRLSGEHALAITAHVCDALSYAHKRGVIHRDIKPANILIDQEGHIKVADFGLAKMHDPSQTSGLTKTNMAMGTPDYVAPEVLSPGMVADHRADLYAVGVMLYQILTGEVPRGMFKLPSQKGIRSDERFDAIICKAMEQDREERYQSAMDVRRDLDVILTTPQPKNDGAGIVVEQEVPQKPAARQPRPPGEQSPPHSQKPEQKAVASPKAKTPPKKQSRATMWLSIGGIIAVLGVAGFLVLGGKSKPQPDSAATNVGAPQPETEPATPIKAHNDSPSPAVTSWLDVTPTIRDSAKTKPGIVMEGELITWNGDKQNPPHFTVTPEGQNDYAVRLKHVGAGQINVRFNEKGFIYVQAAPSGVRINRWMKGVVAPVTLLVAKDIPFSYSKGDPHDLTVTIQGSTISAWLDGQLMGTVDDTMFAEGTGAVALVSYGKVQKVEIADLTPNASPPVPSAQWQDITDSVREKARTKAGLVVESDAVRRESGDGPVVSTMLSSETVRDRAVRVRCTHGAQISLWSTDGGGNAAVLVASNRTIFQTQNSATGATVALCPDVPHPSAFDINQPHELIVAVQGSTVRAWLDDRFVGQAQDDAVKGKMLALGFFANTTVEKVEVGEPGDAQSANEWQPIFMKPEDFGGDLRDVEFRDGTTFLKSRSKAAPAEPSITAIRATLRFCASDRTGSVSLRSTEGAAYGEEDFACMAYVAPSGGMVMKVRDRTTGNPELKRHDFPLSPALKLEESFTFELRATDGKITASINGHEVGSVPDTWKGGARRFSITPSTTEMTEFRDVAVMRTK